MKYTIDNPKLVKSCMFPEENNFTGVVKDSVDDIAYYENGKCHRTDGPAIIYTSGTKEWYIHGKFHREDGPAIEYSDGEKQWWIDGKRHRTDGPATESFDGYKAWYYNGKIYGEDDDFTVESWVKKWQLEIFK